MRNVKFSICNLFRWKDVQTICRSLQLKHQHLDHFYNIWEPPTSSFPSQSKVCSERSSHTSHIFHQGHSPIPNWYLRWECVDLQTCRSVVPQSLPLILYVILLNKAKSAYSSPGLHTGACKVYLKVQNRASVMLKLNQKERRNSLVKLMLDYLAGVHILNSPSTQHTLSDDLPHDSPAGLLIYNL